MTDFQKRLIELNACSAAIEWVGNRDAATAWAECNRGDWMLWLLGRLSGEPGSPSRRKLVGVCAQCAELALPAFEKRRPNDKRMRACLEGCKTYATGENIDIQALGRGADNAFAFAASNAAYTAGESASLVTRSAHYAAFFASTVATYADDAFVARTVTRRRCAEIVRAAYPSNPLIGV